MSFKSLVVAETANRRVLPRTKGMHCDVVAYLSPELFAASEEDLWRDAYRSACFPGARAVYLMPDCHKGYVLPVGGVLVTDGTIVQAGSGYDISCGVVYLRVPGLHAADVADWQSRQRWVAAIEERIATGYRSARLGIQITLVREARFAKMHLIIDEAGQQEFACTINYLIGVFI